MARDLLLRLHPGVLLTVGRGVRGEASSGLSVPGTQHTLTIEEPPNDSPGEQLTLT